MQLTQTNQKSETRPFLSQSPNRVGSGPLGPPRSPGRRVTQQRKRMQGNVRAVSTCGGIYKAIVSFFELFAF
jgi:hypothetical protein